MQGQTPSHKSREAVRKEAQPPVIINTGLRTDIPAFFAPWLVNRLREGFVLVRSPYAPHSVTRYRLHPDVVDVIGFCTKNPAPMLEHMELLKPYGQHWFVTITPYGPEIEPNVPPKERVMEDFIRLSRIVGANSMGWRYDPIFVSDVYTVERHLAEFERMAQTLEGATHTCVISFIDLYEKVRRNFPEAREVLRADRIELGSEMVRIAKKHGMVLRPCAEGDELAAYGADTSGCMTISTYERAIGERLNAPRSKPSRKECACHLSADIGAYHTCMHLCRYCYANYDVETVKKNISLHDPSSPLLIGHLLPGDNVRSARQESWRERQISFL